MKNFLRNFKELFIVIFLIAFLILITNYSEKCDAYYASCLVAISLFVPCFVYFTSLKQIKQAMVKWLYFAGTCFSGLYLIATAFKYYFLESLANSYPYAIFCTTLLAFSIVTLIFTFFYSIKNLFKKNYNLELFDIYNYKKVFNLLVIIATSIIITYPSFFKSYYPLTSNHIIKVVPIAYDLSLALTITLIFYIIGFTIFEIVYHEFKNKKCK